MENVQNLSSANQAYVNNVNNNQGQQIKQTPKNLPTPADSVEISTKQKVPTDKKKIFAMIGALIAAIGIAAIAFRTKFKAKSVQEVLVKARNEINFDKGVATLKESNEKFTGIIKDSVDASGKKEGFKPFEYILEYKDGVLVKSTKKQGNDVIEKTYEVLNDGGRKITTSINGAQGVSKINNTSLLKEEIEKSKTEYQALISKKDELSAQEFDSKAKEIEHLSKKQKEQVTQINEEKVQFEAEEKLKAQQEAIKTQEEAKRAQEEAIKAQEEAKAAKEAAKKVQEMADVELEKFKSELTNKTNAELKSLNSSLDSEYREFVQKMKAKYGCFDEKKFNSDEKIQFSLIRKKSNELNIFAIEKRTSEIVFDSDKKLDVDKLKKQLSEDENQQIFYYQDNSYGSCCNAKNADFLDNIFEEITPIEDDCVLYRGISKYSGFRRDEIFTDNDFEIGKVIHNPGITSTSYAPKTITFNEYVMGDKFGRNDEHYALRIHVKKGAKVLPGGGGEAILPPGNDMKVISFDPATHVVDVEYIAPKN